MCTYEFGIRGSVRFEGGMFQPLFYGTSSNGGEEQPVKLPLFYSWLFLFN